VDHLICLAYNDDDAGSSFSNPRLQLPRRRIWLVEDSPSDARLFAEACSTDGQFETKVILDGADALALIERTRTSDAEPLPDLVLLDLNLPKVSGWDVLERLKGSAEFKTIPVVVFSTSSNADDVTLAYSRGANCFVRKPMNLTEFFRICQGITHHWLCIATLPKRRIQQSSTPE
jgi:CheY-like chemotaxis protein